jgi:hypothetical protein
MCSYSLCFSQAFSDNGEDGIRKKKTLAEGSRFHLGHVEWWFGAQFLHLQRDGHCSGEERALLCNYL